MTYGLSVSSADWGGVDISSGWLPSQYIGSVSTTIRYGGAATSRVDFSGSIPADMQLFAVASTRNGYAYYQDDQFGGYACYYAINCTVSGQVVTVSDALWAGYANASVIGTVVTFQVYGFLPSTPDNDTYGIRFTGSGVPTMLAEGMKPHVARWKKEVDTGAARNLSYNTGIPTTEARPLAFLSDTGRNAIASYMTSNGGFWVVNVIRGFPNCSANYNPAPVSGTLRIVLFTAYSGEEDEYGLSLYDDSGSVVYSTKTPPLMLRRSLNNPTPYSTGSVFTANNTDQFTADELAQEPMILGQLYGIGRISSRYHWELGTVVTSDGKYTVGTIRQAPTVYVGGNANGWWGPTYAGSAGKWIAGTDYF